jgi:hypothetical protein
MLQVRDVDDARLLISAIVIAFRDEHEFSDIVELLLRR